MTLIRPALNYISDLNEWDIDWDDPQFEQGPPVGWWPLGQNEFDLSPYANNGTNNNSVANIPSERGLVHSFNGTSSYIDTNATHNLPQITIAAWVYSNALDSIDYILGGRTSANIGWSFRLRGDTVGDHLELVLHNLGAAISNNDPIPVSTWTHVAVKWDDASNEVIFWINGQRWGTGSISGRNDTIYTTYIGAVNTAGSASLFWNGMLFDVRIYDYVLNDSAIFDIASGRLPTRQRFFPSVALAGPTIYEYSLIAFNAAGDSPRSNIVDTDG